MLSSQLPSDFQRGRQHEPIQNQGHAGSVWSSPVRRPDTNSPPSLWQPPAVDQVIRPVSLPATANYVMPADSPRSFHYQMKSFTGIGAESYRSSFGFPEDRGIAWELQCMRERVLATSRDPNSLVRVPEVVQHKYHSLLLLDTKPLLEASATLGYKTCVYKALSTTDPFVYALRRVDGFRLSNFDLVQDAIEKWSEIKHPNIVSVRQAFATSEFQDVEGQGEGGSLVYVYDYVDLAQTLENWHEANEFKPVHETVLWDVIVQVSMALRLIHSRGLAVRCLYPSKLLVSSRFRIHVNCVGLIDAIHHPSISSNADARKPLVELQRGDLRMLGKIVLILGLGMRLDEVQAMGTEGMIEMALGKLPGSVLKIVKECLTDPEVSAHGLVAMSGAFIAYKAEQLESAQDVVISELRKNIDLTRLDRILVKMCAVADRVHLLEDWRWASTGDRYIVQLFRDYVFFQSDEAGRPFFDVGHVTDCLAKVDVGSFEPVTLMNRDGSSMLITNYNDIRRCIETSFKEIADAARVGGPPAQPLR